MTREVRTIETELEGLPIGLAATVMLGDEGFPEIYSRVSPALERIGQAQFPHLRAVLSPTLSAVRAVALRAKERECAVALVRVGPRLTYLWNSPG